MKIISKDVIEITCSHYGEKINKLAFKPGYIEKTVRLNGETLYTSKAAWYVKDETPITALFEWLSGHEQRRNNSKIGQNRGKEF